MNKFLLDSDVIIHILRGHIPREYLNNIDGMFCVSVISLSEVLYGQKKLGVLSREPFLFEFLAVLKVQVFPVRLEEVSEYINIRLYLEGLGTPLEKFDLLIAATALVHNARLITKNLKHFSRIPNLKTYS